VAASLSGLTLGSVVIVAAIPHPPGGVPPLYAAGLAAKPCAPHDVIVVPAGSRQRYYLSSNVLDTAPVTACQQAAVSADRQWLSAGIIPGGSPQVTSMATRALLDLHLSTRPDGAVIAGWHNRWEYSWPRDSSWAAVALAYTGHAGDSLRVLRFLQQMQLKSGTWAARYWPDGSGPVDDGRPAELDANGWVPWAVWCWSVEESHETSAAQWARAASRLADGITAGFGRYGYHRLPYADSGDDAAVTFLGPPFAAAGPAVVSAITDTERSLRLPNGGMLPGSDWPGNRTTAWTAETAFFALSDAETGHRQQASQLLTWFATHTTRLGTLPEKVDARGQPVSSAPLAWTDAAVLLTLVAQAHRLPMVPIPAG
jgi:hypothetical protein